MSQVVTTSYDYSLLDLSDAGAVRAAAERIHKLNSDLKNSMISAGRELLLVKEKLPHGEFGKWLSVEFDMAERTARRYMRAAEWANGKSDIVAVLDQTAIYELASAPVQVTEEVETLIGSGHRPSLDLVRMKVVEAKAAARRARQAEERSRRRRQPTPAELKREQRQNAKAEREAAAARQRQELRDRLAAGAVEILVKLPEARLVLEALEIASGMVASMLRKRLGGGE